MAKRGSNNRGKSAETIGLTSPAPETGQGGETHQVAGGDVPVLTTQQGIPVPDDQNSLRIGARGPTALEDIHFREKLFHLDHERIPERVVHARGFGAHGFFEVYESLAGRDRGKSGGRLTSPWNERPCSMFTVAWLHYNRRK
jgi:catalase